jgi:HAAS
MDKLEQYLDQVCRGIGGPLEMRRHIRQELREHLLDAIAQHKAGGLADESALEKALAEFGRPEEVRSELVATHGQRMTWIIDKAMQWKEMTMKAKWLWMSWAYGALGLVITLAVLWIAFANVFLVPRFQKLVHDGMIDRAVIDQTDLSWMIRFVNGVNDAFAHSTTWLLLLAIVAVGLFEWRVKSENKAWIRLSALGTAALGVLVLAVLMAGSMIITFEMSMPALGRMARPFALAQIRSIDSSLSAMEQALAKKDWKAMQDPSTEASNALGRLAAGPAVTSLTAWNAPPTVDELRAKLKAAHDSFTEAQQAIRAEDAGLLAKELEKLRKSFEPLREAAKKATP